MMSLALEALDAPRSRWDFFVIAKGCRALPRGTTRKRAFFSKKDLALSLIPPMISPPYGKDFMA
jgi:hypothetical protein